MPDLAILCGGEGRRLRSILPSLPKPMAEFGGRPFLSRLINEAAKQGFRRIVLCTGYGRAAIRAYFAENPPAIELAYSEETTPLGTGGAIIQALSVLQTELILVMNGDSYVPSLNLRSFYAAHQDRAASASLVVVPADHRSDVGKVVTDQSGRVVRFDEKGIDSPGQYSSAGIYLISRRVLEDFVSGTSYSMEVDIIPKIIERGLHVFIESGELFDIGTPERFMTAQARSEIQTLGD